MPDELNVPPPEVVPPEGEPNTARWMQTLAAMRQEGLAYGKTFSFDWLREHLQMEFPSRGWGFAITAINDAILPQGYCLTQDTVLSQYRIGEFKECCEAADNQFVKSSRAAWRAKTLYEGLLSNPTAQTIMTDEERNVLMAKQNKAAWRYQLMAYENERDAAKALLKRRTERRLNIAAVPVELPAPQPA